MTSLSSTPSPSQKPCAVSSPPLTHLDARRLLIKSNPGEVVKPDHFKAIDDEGMPMYQRPFMKGKLYIHFAVEFPESVNPDQCRALEAILPPRTPSKLTDMELDECEETKMHDVNIEDEMGSSGPSPRRPTTRTMTVTMALRGGFSARSSEEEKHSFVASTTNFPFVISWASL